MKQVDALHYRFGSYITRERFISYWRQVVEVLELRPRTVLEIGPGPGVVTMILRGQDISVTTVDIADDVGADLVGSVTKLPIKDKSFDIVLCSQVLEHLPFSRLDDALSEIERVARIGAVISLPRADRYWTFAIRTPKLGTKILGLNLQIKPTTHVFDGEHYWEIGKDGYSVKCVRQHFNVRFGRVRDFRLKENPYHQFFICRNI